MKHLYSALIGFLFFLSPFLSPQTAHAQAVPDNVYYIPLPEQQLKNAFDEIVSDPISNTIIVNISLVSTGDNAVIYYDHWEDGYQASYPGTRQGTTQVWGDNNPANGIPPGYSVDRIMSGDRINLSNNVALPRSVSVVVYDGRDRIASTQFLSVTRTGIPTSPGSVIGSAVEVYDTTVYDREFQLPIGETTDTNSGTGCCLFEYTSIVIMARENGTVVTIDPKGTATNLTSVTIQQGESYHFTNATVGDVVAGAKVTANKPVQVDLITGDVGSTYESRTFAMYPTSLWDNCYYNPVGQTTPNAEVHAFIYNPGTSSLTVKARTMSGITSFSVASKATYRYVMPQGSGAHFYTDNEADRFFAVGVHDADATEQAQWDWGFALLPEVFLSTAAVVGYGPGTTNPVSNTGNGSPVWVLAIKTTTIYADFDGDPTTGPLVDPNGGRYNVAYPVTADQSLRIFDDSDRDQTGMRVYTLDGTRIAVAWGEDAEKAGTGLPFIDLGTTVTPARQINFSKQAIISIDNGTPGLIDPGDEVTYRIILENQSLRSRDVISITDTIPAGLQYVANSTRRNRTTIIADQNAPDTAFPLDQAGYKLGDLLLGQKDTLSFRVVALRSIVADASVTNQVRYVDSSEDTLRSQVTVPINQNFAPTANRNDTLTAFNTTLTIPILRNDLDRALRPASLLAVTLPTVSVQAKHGVAMINADGTLTYNPDDAFAGRDTLIYRLCDKVNPSLCDTALVTIGVGSAPPVANPDSRTTVFNTALTIGVLENDVDRAGRPAGLSHVSTPAIIRQPANGTLVVNRDGSISYDPDDAFAGLDSFIYQICDKVDPTKCDTALVHLLIESAPPLARPESVTTAFRTAVDINVLQNDVDKASQPATLSTVTGPVITQQPVNGSLTLTNGMVRYNPNDTFVGSDSFIYRICDTVDPTKCDTALVVIRVESAPPVAEPDSVTTTFDTPVEISVLENDVDKASFPATLDNVSLPELLSGPANGTALVEQDGRIRYRPNETFAGADTLFYRICDKVDPTKCDTARVIINVGSAPPVARPDSATTAYNTTVRLLVLENDTDKANRSATPANVHLPELLSGPINGTAIGEEDGTITYTPAEAFAGFDTLFYRICDLVEPGLCDTARVVIRVGSAPPVAGNDDTEPARFNTDVTVFVLTNDRDRSGRPASLTSVTAPGLLTQPRNGTVSVNNDGSLTYNPDDTFSGNDTLSYRICDLVDPSLCDTADVFFTIQPGASVGGVVFRDVNRNGTREWAEKGVSGIRIVLYLEQEGSLVGVDSLLSKEDGSYRFEDLPSGTYQVQFKPGRDSQFAPANVGTDDTIDSDADSGGFSDAIRLIANGSGSERSDQTVFAGLLANECNTEICLPVRIKKTQELD